MESAFSSGAPLSLLLRVPGPGCTLESIGELKKITMSGLHLQGARLNTSEPGLGIGILKSTNRASVQLGLRTTGLVLSLSQPMGPRLFFPQRSLCLLLFKGGSLELCSKGLPGLLFFSWRTLYWSLPRAQRSLKSTERSKFLKDSHFISNLLTVYTEYSIVNVFSLFFSVFNSKFLVVTKMSQRQNLALIGHQQT